MESLLNLLTKPVEAVLQLFTNSAKTLDSLKFIQEIPKIFTSFFETIVQVLNLLKK